MLFYTDIGMDWRLSQCGVGQPQVAMEDRLSMVQRAKARGGVPSGNGQPIASRAGIQSAFSSCSTPSSLPLPWRSGTNCSRLRTDGNCAVAVRRWRSRIVRRHGLVGRRIRSVWSRHGCGCPEVICCPSAQPKGPDVSSAWIRASSSEHSRRQGQLAGCYSTHRIVDSHTPDHSTPLTSLSRRFCCL
jgi:hypothetical protein